MKRLIIVATTFLTLISTSAWAFQSKPSLGQVATLLGEELETEVSLDPSGVILLRNGLVCEYRETFAVDAYGVADCYRGRNAAWRAPFVYVSSYCVSSGFWSAYSVWRCQ